MTDIPIKNATNEKDLPVAVKIDIANGISAGFQLAVGFWLFTLIFSILVIAILWAVGVKIVPVVD